MKPSMKELFLLCAVLLFSSFSISKEDKSKMSVEAENWIDDIPVGLQDRLSDAVSHAERGFFNEINYIRGLSDTTKSEKKAIDISDIQLGKTGDIKARLYIPENVDNKDSLQVLIYFHGGGWSMGSLNSVDKFCTALSVQAKVKIYSIDYPLTPEHPHPAAINTCIEAVTSIREMVGEKIKFSLGGDGAGGNLALETWLTLQKNQDSIGITSLLLYYPLLKSSGELNTDLKNKYGRNYGFDSRLWEAFIEAYKAPSDNLQSMNIKNLPNTLMISAGRDIVIDQALEFYKNNPQIEFIEFEDSLHGFITDGHQLTAFRLAVDLSAQFLTTES